MSQIYVICTSYDSESNLLFSGIKILCDLPTHILKIDILKKYVGAIPILVSNSDSALNFASIDVCKYRNNTYLTKFHMEMKIA